MTVPLPSSGSTSWYSWASQVDSLGRTATPGPKAHTDYTGKPDGAMPSAGDEGIAMVSFRDTSAVTNPPTISGGKLIGNLPAAGGVASYVDQQLGAKVLRIGADFGFGSGDGVNGAICLAAWVAPQASISTVQDTHCHFAINPTSWTFTIWQGNVNSAALASGTFATPLAQDGTNLRAEARFDGSTVTLILPDNSIALATDSRIGSIVGTVACWEFYRYLSTGNDVLFYRTWADTQAGPLGLASSAGAAKIAQKTAANRDPVVQFYAPATGVDILVPTTLTDVDATNLAVTFTLPGDCTAALVEINAYVQMFGAAELLWAYREGGTTFGTQAVVNGQYTGTLNYKNKRTGFAAGTTHTIIMQHFSSVASVAYLSLSYGSGYAATITVTPLVA